MGVDFTAVLSHPWSAGEVLQLPHTLSRAVAPQLATATDNLYRLLGPIYVNMHAEECWQIDPYYQDDLPHPDQLWHDGLPVKVDGPAGVLLWIGPHTIDVWNVTRWRTFLTEKTLQDCLRAVCHALAAITRAAYVIYLPDSGFSVSEALDLVYSGKTLDEVRGFLEMHHGPPVSDFADIYERDEEDWQNGNGYFIDRCDM
jgi:hypothetical protein